VAAGWVVCPARPGRRPATLAHHVGWDVRRGPARRGGQVGGGDRCCGSGHQIRRPRRL